MGGRPGISRISSSARITKPTDAALYMYADATPLWAATGDDPAAQRWQRDAPLFEVAGSAREQRAERAWERLRAAG